MGSAADHDFMGLALRCAQQAADQHEVPIGAVVVRHGQVIGQGHNAPVTQQDPTAHAEVQALRAAARALGNYRLDGCTVYVTVEPCAMCAQALLHARVGRVVFGAAEPKTGAAGSVLNLFQEPRLNHQTQVQGGLRADEAATLLQTFFQQRRAESRQVATPLRQDALRTPDARFEPVWGLLPEWQTHQRWLTQGAALDGLRLHALDLPPYPGGDISTSAPARACMALHDEHSWWPQWWEWAEQQRQAGCRVLLPDLIGHGQSDKPKKAHWHSLERHAQVLAEALQAWRIEELRLTFPPSMQALAERVRALAQAQLPALTAYLEMQEPPEPSGLPTQWRALPYPDAGHQAAERAWPWPLQT